MNPSLACLSASRMLKEETGSVSNVRTIEMNNTVRTYLSERILCASPGAHRYRAASSVLTRRPRFDKGGPRFPSIAFKSIQKFRIGLCSISLFLSFLSFCSLLLLFTSRFADYACCIVSEFGIIDCLGLGSRYDLGIRREWRICVALETQPRRLRAQKSCQDWQRAWSWFCPSRVEPTRKYCHPVTLFRSPSPVHTVDIR